MVKVQEFSYKGQDEITVFSKKWTQENNPNPKAIIQLAHGMAEHVDRYDEFARVLCGQGIFVYGNDHRGHGKTGKATDSIGYFSDENGFDKAVEDMHTLTNLIKNENPSIPIFLLGHSMGSFLARRYIQRFGDEIAGVILSGTGGDPGSLGKVGIMLASIEGTLKGKKKPSPLMNKLTFASYNKGFKNARTDFDWLTSDESIVDKYIQDPLCGGIFSSGFYKDLLTGIQTIHEHEKNSNIPKHLPMLIFSGDRDPVGGNAKGVTQAYHLYKNLGIKDISLKLYPNGRHEMLNERNKEEVFEDIVTWTLSKVQ